MATLELVVDIVVWLCCIVLRLRLIVLTFALQVAIKVMDTKKIKEDYVRQNLHREAKIMARLRHPNVIRLYETLKVRKYLFIRITSLLVVFSCLVQVALDPSKGAKRLPKNK